MVQEGELNLTECYEPGCTAPAETIYEFDVRAVTFDGRWSTVYFERRMCTEGHYLDIEVYDDPDDD